MDDVFISYASGDRAHAETLRDRLQAEGFSVWFDRGRLEAGFDWYESIRIALENCRVVIPVLTPRWKLSEWTRFETYGAVCVIPAVFEGDFRAKGPAGETDWAQSVATPPLSRLQYVDLSPGQAGDANWEKLFQAVQRERDRPMPDRTGRFTRLRHDPSPRLIGRDLVLLEMHERMFGRRISSHTQGHVEVVTGLGGAGKTALAREYVEKFWRCYARILWLDVNHGLVPELAEASDRMFPDGAGAKKTSEEKASALVHFLRSLRDGRHTLLVLDCAESEKDTLPWLPLSGECHILITSRDANWFAASFTLVPLAKLSADDSKRALLLAAKREEPSDSCEKEDLDQVIQKLDGLPLALEMAGRYVREQGENFGFGDFLRVHEEAEQKQLDRHIPGSTEYSVSVYAALKASVEKLTPGARMLLHMACHLAPAAVPLKLWLDAREVVQAVLAKEAGGKTTESGAGDLTEAAIRAWKDELIRYAIIQPSDEGRSFVVHQVVRSIVRLESRKVEFTWIEHVLKLLGAVAPAAGYDVSNWDAWKPLLPHAQFVSSLDHLPVAVPPGLLTGMAGYLWAQGRYLEAEPPARNALQHHEAASDAGNLEFIRGIELMANVCRGLGRNQEANEHFQRALDLRMRLGVEDESLIAALGNYASFLAASGALQQASQLFDKALDVAGRICQRHDPALLNLFNNYALLLESLGRYEDARKLFSHAFEGFSQCYGPEHHETLAARVNLGSVLESLSREDGAPDPTSLLREAESHYRDALAAAPPRMGPTHPVLLRARQNLARLCVKTGREKEGEALCREVLTLAERDTGPSSLETCTVVATLAEMLDDMNRTEEATPHYERACNGLGELLGGHHPQTLHCLESFGLMLRGMNRWQDAAKVLGSHLDGCMKSLSLGWTDFQSLNVAANRYAHVLEQLGRHKADIEAEIRSRAEKFGIAPGGPPI